MYYIQIIYSFIIFFHNNNDMYCIKYVFFSYILSMPAPKWPMPKRLRVEMFDSLHYIIYKLQTDSFLLTCTYCL